MTVRLSRASLDQLDPAVGRPGFDPAAVTAGIVHIGVGGFHRAHMAMIVNELLAAGETDWGICGLGLLEGDRRMERVLREQDHLYTLTERTADGGESTAVIASIVDFVFAPGDTEAAIERLADPATRIVSLTITEGGYNVDRVTGEFDFTAPAAAADLQGETPSTVFGVVTEALRRRRERDAAAFTVLSCDNVQNNGDVARSAFAAFAARKDPDLGAWVEEHVAFPNSMVDRITPATTDADVASIAERIGVLDEWPVVAEPFFQWVIEDRFPAGRPAFETTRTQLVGDVEPYELMKLRLLNASHQALAYFAYLSGYRLVSDAAADPLIAEFLLRYMTDEATPTLLPVPGVDLAAYRKTLIERFANPAVRDTVARLCAESSDRIPTWLVPVIRERLAAGGSVELAAAIVASWARYAEGVDEDGEPIEVVDRLRDDLVPIAQSQREDPLAFVRNRALFGDLADDDRFTAPYLAALDSLHSVGAQRTLARLIGGSVIDAEAAR